jgi:hypothetical protein
VTLPTGVSAEDNTEQTKDKGHEIISPYITNSKAYEPDWLCEYWDKVREGG